MSGVGLRLEGRAAIVTGAAAGLGRAFAEGLACHGARVAAWDMDGGRLEGMVEAIRRINAARILFDVVDVTSAEQVSVAAARVVKMPFFEPGRKRL